jgi:hypothetical protein
LQGFQLPGVIGGAGVDFAQQQRIKVEGLGLEAVVG